MLKEVFIAFVSIIILLNTIKLFLWKTFVIRELLWSTQNRLFWAVFGHDKPWNNQFMALGCLVDLSWYRLTVFAESNNSGYRWKLNRLVMQSGLTNPPININTWFDWSKKTAVSTIQPTRNAKLTLSYGLMIWFSIS